MSFLTDDIQKLTLAEKAELYHLLDQDEELNKYLYSDNRLFEELERRDNAAANGEIELLSRTQLTELLQKRRNEV